jgi:hypothetical protein
MGEKVMAEEQKVPEQGTQPAVELAKKDGPKRADLVVKDDSAFSMYLDTGRFEQLQRAARMFSESGTIPVHYQKKPADCFIGITRALLVNMDPFTFMQHTYVIGNKLGMEAQLAIALVNSRGPFTGPIQWRESGKGNDKAVTAYATHRITGEVCEATVTWAMVEAEGWAAKNGSKWKTMPDIMFKYRSASFLARLYCPEVLMGMRTVDELDDIRDVTATILPSDGKSHSFSFAGKAAAPAVDAPAAPETEQSPVEDRMADLVQMLRESTGAAPSAINQAISEASPNGDGHYDIDALEARIKELVAPAPPAGKKGELFSREPGQEG